MNPLLKRISGFLLVITSIIGILISVFLLYQVWHLRQPVSDRIQSGLNLISSTLKTTDDGLSIAEQAVNNVYTSTLSLQDATSSLAQFVHDAGNLTDSTATMVGENLITTISNTQTAVASAQVSAEVIDGIITALSNIPLIGISQTPNTTLSDALGQVSRSLDPLPASLKNIQSALVTTKDNMQMLEEQVTGLNQDIAKINQNLVLARDVIDNYQTEVSQLESWVQTGQDSLPKWITTLSWFMTIIIVWLVTSQIGMLLQGIDLLAQKR